MKNPYRKLILSLLIIMAHSFAFAQKKVKVKVEYFPQKTYRTNMVNNMEMTMNFKGDAEDLKKINASGQFPMVMQMVQDMGITTKTGARRKDTKIPLVLTYDKMAVTQKINGKEVPGNAPNPFAGAVIEGIALEDGQMAIDTIKGNIKDDVKKMLKDIVKGLQGKISFPSDSLKVGDHFVQNIPMAIPLPQATVNMNVNVTYTLKEIKDQTAIFDIAQLLSIEANTAQMKADGSGTGTGTAVYDLGKKYMTRYDTDSDFTIQLPVGKLVMEMLCTAKASVTSAIE